MLEEMGTTLKTHRPTLHVQEGVAHLYRFGVTCLRHGVLVSQVQTLSDVSIRMHDNLGR